MPIIWGAQAASPPQDRFAVVNLLVSAANGNELRRNMLTTDQHQ